MEVRKDVVRCKGCGLPLREVQIRLMLGNPTYTEWCRVGYCSFDCFQAHTRNSTPAPPGIEEAALSRPSPSELHGSGMDNSPAERVSQTELAETTVESNAEAAHELETLEKRYAMRYGIVAAIIAMSIVLFLVYSNVPGLVNSQRLILTTGSVVLAGLALIGLMAFPVGLILVAVVAFVGIPGLSAIAGIEPRALLRLLFNFWTWAPLVLSTAIAAAVGGGIGSLVGRRAEAKRSELMGSNTKN